MRRMRHVEIDAPRLMVVLPDHPNFLERLDEIDRRHGIEQEGRPAHRPAARCLEKNGSPASTRSLSFLSSSRAQGWRMGLLMSETAKVEFSLTFLASGWQLRISIALGTKGCAGSNVTGRGPLGSAMN